MPAVPAYRLANATMSKADKAARAWVNGSRPAARNAYHTLAPVMHASTTDKAFDYRFAALCMVAVMASAFIGASLALI